jgi:hypothetical protein
VNKLNGDTEGILFHVLAQPGRPVLAFAAVTNTVELNCPVGGCPYRTNMMLGLGQDEDYNGMLSAQELLLQLEHPQHPGVTSSDSSEQGHT